MTTAEELDQILSLIKVGNVGNTLQPAQGVVGLSDAKAALHRLILKERREELQKIVDVINSWPTSEAGHFLLLHLEERNRHLTTEIERSSNG